MSFPRYPEYKDSGDAGLGLIPSHWRIARIGDVAKVVNGYPFDSALFSDDGAYPLIRIRDLGVSETATRYDGDFVEAAAVTSSDVLIGMDGDFNVGRWLGTGTALLNQRMCCIRTSSPELTKLLEYALPQPLRVINDLTYATTVKHLSSSQVEKIRLGLAPDRDELSAIVGFLDRETAKIDALVAEQETLIALLQEKRQAVISHAVTKGLNPNVPMKDSGVEWLGEVPEHWEVIPAKRVASIFVPQRNKPDLNADGDGHFWVTMEQMHSEEINSAELTVTEVAARDAGTRILPAGAVVASCVGSFGLAAINSVDVIINQQLQAFIPNNHVDARFLRHCVVIAKCYFEQIGTAATIAYVNQLGFANMPMPLPPEEEQHQIVAFLAVESVKFDTLMAEARTAITLLQERRTALISAAVTGQIDVRGLVGGVNTPD